LSAILLGSDKDKWRWNTASRAELCGYVYEISQNEIYISTGFGFMAE
jgi:hypothetical protein